MGEYSSAAWGQDEWGVLALGTKKADLGSGKGSEQWDGHHERGQVGIDRGEKAEEQGMEASCGPNSERRNPG